MFTGLIQEMGAVKRIGRRGGYLVIEIAYDEGNGPLREGDSMAVNGVCVTAARLARGHFTADLSRETQERTTLRRLTAGDRVNLERPVRPTDPLGGHIVLGHVDSVGTIRRVRAAGGGTELDVHAGAGTIHCLVPKGSIAVDGVSLTVGELDRETFRIFIIPETLRRTTLGTRRTGTQVNLEVDYLAKLVKRFVDGSAEGKAGPGAVYPLAGSD